MKASKKIQIFGERCSGTNYVESLVAANFPASELTSDFGYKHFFPQFGSKSTDSYIFLIIHRHPISWLKSFYRTPWHASPELKRLNFSQFIRAEWISVWDTHAGISKGDPRWMQEMEFERCPSTMKRFDNVLKMRTVKIREWERLRVLVENAVYVRYEDVVEHPQEFISQLASELNLPAPSSLFRIDSYKGGKRWHRGLREQLLRKRIPEISTLDLQYILENIDKNLEKRIGYNL